MPVTADQPAPYAPASAVLDLVTRHRNKGLQSPVDADVLARSGISESLIPRTLQALRVLDLLTDEGRPSEVLEGIRLAPESEYTQRLTDWLTAAYADALAYVDPANDDEVRIRDAFRSYVPTGQQGRMVSLFIGLFKAAGVMPDRQRQSASKESPPAKPPMKAVQRPVSRARENGGGGNTGGQRQPGLVSDGLPPALAGLLATLPKEGAAWSQNQRDKFIRTFEAVVDYSFAIQEPSQLDTATDQ